jgi:hypothetical protein
MSVNVQEYGPLACGGTVGSEPTLDQAIREVSEIAWESDDAILLGTVFVFLDTERGVVLATGHYAVLASFNRPVLVITAGPTTRAFRCVPFGAIYRPEPVPA